MAGWLLRGYRGAAKLRPLAVLSQSLEQLIAAVQSMGTPSRDNMHRHSATDSASHLWKRRLPVWAGLQLPLCWDRTWLLDTKPLSHVTRSSPPISRPEAVQIPVFRLGGQCHPRAPQSRRQHLFRVLVSVSSFGVSNFSPSRFGLRLDPPLLFPSLASLFISVSALYLTCMYYSPHLYVFVHTSYLPCIARASCRPCRSQPQPPPFSLAPAASGLCPLSQPVPAIPSCVLQVLVCIPSAFLPLSCLLSVSIRFILFYLFCYFYFIFFPILSQSHNVTSFAQLHRFHAPTNSSPRFPDAPDDPDRADSHHVTAPLITAASLAPEAVFFTLLLSHSLLDTGCASSTTSLSKFNFITIPTTAGHIASPSGHTSDTTSLRYTTSLCLVPCNPRRFTRSSLRQRLPLRSS